MSLSNQPYSSLNPALLHRSFYLRERLYKVYGMAWTGNKHCISGQSHHIKRLYPANDEYGGKSGFSYKDRYGRYYKAACNSLSSLLNCFLSVKFFADFSSVNSIKYSIPCSSAYFFRAFSCLASPRWIWANSGEQGKARRMSWCRWKRVRQNFRAS